MKLIIDDPLEDEIQRFAAKFLDLLTSPEGDGKLFWFHVPNGGFRNKRVAVDLKAQGVKPGVPDIIIEEIPPRFQAAKGVRIELKRKKGVPSDVKPHQKEMLQRYHLRGYRTYVCFGIDQFLSAINECGFS